MGPNGWVPIGVRTLTGFVPFENGEQLIGIRQGADRVPLIRLSNGTMLPFDVWKDGSRKRGKILEELNRIDPMYGQLYLFAARDFPEIDYLIRFHGSSKEEYPCLEYTNGFCRVSGGLDVHASIVVGNSPEPQRHYGKLLEDRKTSVQVVAQLMVIDVEVLRRHPEFLAQFIFLHEVGHAHDYIVNYVNRAQDSDPLQAKRNVRAQEMAGLPYPGLNPADIKSMHLDGRLAVEFENHRKYFENKGIVSVGCLVEAQERAYRGLPSESYADNFAVGIIKKYWKELGWEEATKQEQSKPRSSLLKRILGRLW